MSQRCLKSESGFTLIEIIIVTVLIAVLSSIIFTSLNGIIDTRDTFERQAKVSNQARLLISQLLRELSSITTTPVIQQKGKATEGSNPSNPYQSLAQGRSPIFGENNNFGRYSRDILTFTSRGSGREGGLKVANRGDIQVSYYLEDSNIENEAGVEAYSFLRKEQPAGVTEEEVLEERSFELTLAVNVVHFRVRFLEDLAEPKWAENWDDKKRGTPLAVELTLGLVNDIGGISTYRTAQFLRESTNSRDVTSVSSMNQPPN